MDGWPSWQSNEEKTRDILFLGLQQSVSLSIITPNIRHESQR